MLQNSDSHFETVITDFIKAWYEKQRRQLNELIGANLPEYDETTLRSSALNNLLVDIAAAANDQLLPSASNRKLIDEKINLFMSVLFSVNLSAAKQINVSIVPKDFWLSPIGHVVLRAQLWVLEDELITLTEASKLCGKSYSTLRGMIDRGTIQNYPDPQVTNPQRQARVLRSKILRIAATEAKNN